MKNLQSMCREYVTKKHLQQTFVRIEFKHEQPGYVSRNQDSSVNQVCVFMYPYMQQRKPLPYPEISADPVQLILVITFLNQKQHNYIVNTFLFQCVFWAAKGPLLSPYCIKYARRRVFTDPYSPVYRIYNFVFLQKFKRQ